MQLSYRRVKEVNPPPPLKMTELKLSRLSLSLFGFYYRNECIFFKSIVQYQWKVLNFIFFIGNNSYNYVYLRLVGWSFWGRTSL